MLPNNMGAATGKFIGSNPSKAIEASPDCECCCTPPAPRARASEHLPLIPAIALVLLPKCPLCIAAWFGILGYLGASSWLSAMWGAPLAVGLLSFAVGALALRALRRRDPRPLLVGTLGAAAILIGKDMMDASPLLYAGLALLVASFWNSRLKSNTVDA
jgi:hypothetical protein